MRSMLLRLMLRLYLRRLMRLPGRLLRTLRLYLRLQLFQARAILEYRADFWLNIAGLALRQAALFIFIIALFTKIPSVQGWNRSEVILLYSLAVVPRGIVQLFFNGVWWLPGYINTGHFDQLLVRPFPILLQVMALDFSFEGLANIGLGVFGIVYASVGLGFQWSFAKGAFLALTLFVSVIIMASIDLAAHCTLFWSPSSGSRVPYVIEYLVEFAKFPITLYDQFIRTLITWVLPFAFVSYFPAVILLGKVDAASRYVYLSPLMGALVAVIAALIWKIGLRQYQSSGS